MQVQVLGAGLLARRTAAVAATGPRGQSAAVLIRLTFGTGVVLVSLRWYPCDRPSTPVPDLEDRDALSDSPSRHHHRHATCMPLSSDTFHDKLFTFDRGDDADYDDDHDEGL